MRGTKKLLAVMLMAGLVVAGCSSKTDTKAAEPAAATDSAKKFDVAVSFYPMYEFTKAVTGDLANVEVLVSPGVEPHDWEPTPKDMTKISESDAFVYQGGGLETWADQVLGSVKSDKLNVIEASHGIEQIAAAEGEEEDHDHATEGTGEAEHDEHDHDHGGMDPHMWLSPALAIKEVQNIEAGLAKAKPEYKDEFKKNADAYIAKLQELDKAFKDGLANVKRKDFITQHAAFGYLAKEYGLTQVPIAGLSPDQEPTAAQMANVVKFAKEHQVKTIFFETLVSSKVAEAIASEIGAKSAVLNPIEGLTKEDETNNETYLTIMQKNLDALKTALNE